ncbi:ATP-binding protein [Limosilactobacillus equigenerosi]|nr:ATP-binding protein [Limosilactobacillus equigenerosi]
MATKQIQRINVLHNGQPAQLAIEEIFDAVTYPNLQAITGQIEPEFANQYLGDFLQANLILGDQALATSLSKDDTLTKDAILTAMLQVATKTAAKLFQAFSSQLQVNVLADVFQLKTAPTQALHSRYVLLSNPTTEAKRVVLGINNFATASFTADHNQVETILIFDDAQLFDQLQANFTDQVLPLVTNLFSADLLKAAETQMKAAKDTKNPVVILDNETTDALVESELTELLATTVDEHVKAGVLDKQAPLAMRNATINRTRERESEQRLIMQRDMLLQLEKEAVSPRAEQPGMRAKSQIAKKVQAALAQAISPEDLAVEKKYTTYLYDRPMERDLANGQTGLYTPSDTGDFALPFGQRASEAEIKAGLKQIDAVMQGYQKYVVDYDDDYGKRFFEAILYGFTAPYLWEIRTKASLNPEDGNDVPNFLILGATAGSGKSTLLRIINQLTWGTDQAMIDFGTIYPADAAQRKAKTVQALEAYMKQDSTYPVLVDEIEPYFFQQPQYSRHLVVDTMNELINRPKAIAPLIGTTNYNGSFSMVREAARRSYYLQLDKVIDADQKEAATQYIYEVRQQLDNKLFKDFVVRMAEKLADDDTNWRQFGDNKQLDFLAVTRDIFRDYYQAAKMSVPSYLGDGLCDDFRETARNKWAKLYLTQMEDFVYRQENNSLVFDITKLNSFNGFGAEASEEYRNSLPIELCVDGINGKTGKFVEMKATDFFNWIGVEPNLKTTTHDNGTVKTTTTAKPKKKGFWARLFGGN